mgnify:CR=1 FL=1
MKRNKVRIETLKLMMLLILVFPVPLYFGITGKHHTSIMGEYKEYIDCWRDLCIMFYSGKKMVPNPVDGVVHDREVEHL